MDWVAALQEQAAIATKMAQDVAQLLSVADLTATQASQAYRMVEKCAQSFDQFVELMEEHDLDPQFFKVAEGIEDMWSQLSVASAAKVRELS